jgi:hypothetical protein
MTFEEALAAHRAGDYETAEQGYLANLNTRNVAFNLGGLYQHLGRFEDAEAVFGQILEQYPDFAPAARARGVCLLALRRYAEAWPLYEARREVSEEPPPLTDAPEWDGKAVAGERLTVVGEQGFGDQIMFARYVPGMVAAGADVTVACNPRELARFFETAGFATTSYPSPGAPMRSAGSWALLNSLPAKLGALGPPPPVYMSLPEPSTISGVGVAVRGNPANYNDANRSLPPEAAAELLKLGRDLSPQATGTRDFLETAEIIAGLELVITVDSAPAHVAGALGKPCWVLLPRLGMDWRWNDGERSDWYPQARLFRQDRAGDWSTVLQRVREALGEKQR